MGTTYKRNLKRIEFLKKCLPDHEIIEMWECEWDNNVRSNTQLKEFVNSFEVIDPIIPRDALFGGRTNAVKLHYKCK